MLCRRIGATTMRTARRPFGVDVIDHAKSVAVPRGDLDSVALHNRWSR
jgi:hypothetical protein